MSTRDSPGGKGGRCVRLTTYHPCSAERQEIRGLNLPGPPSVISKACCGRDLYLYLETNSSIVLDFRNLKIDHEKLQTRPTSDEKFCLKQRAFSDLA